MLVDTVVGSTRTETGFVAAGAGASPAARTSAAIIALMLSLHSAG
jgi:hypothetical protein